MFAGIVSEGMIALVAEVTGNCYGIKGLTVIQ